MPATNELPDMSRRRFIRGSAFALGATIVSSGSLATLLSACARPEDATSALSASDIENATGTVRALLWEGYDNPEAYEGLTRVELEASYLAQAEDTLTKLRPAGTFDVTTTWNPLVQPLIAAGLIVPMDVGLLRNHGDLFPVFREESGGVFSSDGEHYGVPYIYSTLAISHDPDVIPQIRNFDDLMSDELRGRVGVSDDPISMIALFARFAGKDDIHLLTDEDLAEVMALLDEFSPQIRTVATAFGELPAMYARGEIAAAIPDTPNTVVNLKPEGVNLQFAIPDVGAISGADAWFMVDGAPNEAAAYALIDWAIGESSQAIQGNYLGYGITNQKAVPSIDPELAQAWQYDNIDELFERAPFFEGVPLEPDDGVTSYDDWLNAWQDFKARLGS
jgi:spermidine/putrescine-binding protein